MDPLTHALLGASAARVALARPLGAAAWLPGAVGALLPDVDGAIRSASDPLLYAEFHRHFTHSLAFIPIGGAIAALPWVARSRFRPHWRPYVIAATVGYATHGVLDASTTYGTLLLWPFSDSRIAWNWISIVDPLFTLVIACGVAAAIWRGSAGPVIAALLLCMMYVATGAAQRARALDAQLKIAAARGHELHRGAVFPAFATNMVWRSLYQAEDRLYMDRVRVPWFGSASWVPGSSVTALREVHLPVDVRADARLSRDFRRFWWFSDGWVALAPTEPDLIGDARYSSSTERFEPVWGIRFTPDSAVPIAWIDRSRQRRVSPRAVWLELIGEAPGQRPVPRD
jgi:inner membrane protein